jgi:hypothetical protein
MRHDGSLRCEVARSQGAELDEVSLFIRKQDIMDGQKALFCRMLRHREEGSVILSSQQRKRIVAVLCLFAAVALYAPLAGAAWSAHAMSCCTGDYCPIAQHHHNKKASPHSEMDCGHDMGELIDCSMSCCESSEKPLVTAVAFVLPRLVSGFAPASVVAAAEDAHSVAIPQSAEPLSPPPRLQHIS